MNRLRTTLVTALALTGATAAGAGAQTVPTQVAVELALLVDVSGSVNSTEFNLQRQGYINAFSNANLYNNFISTLPTSSIAVSFAYWSSAGEQSQLGGTGTWYLINSAASSLAFANAIAGFARPFSGVTAPGSAINFICPQFATNNFVGARRVIDVSGDGSQNDGANTAAARNNCLAATTGANAINGLAILGSEAGLDTWYQNNIVGGQNAFLEVANDFADFDAALQRKIGREISNPTVPEPSTYVLLGTGLLAVAGIAHRRRRTA